MKEKEKEEKKKLCCLKILIVFGIIIVGYILFKKLFK